MALKNVLDIKREINLREVVLNLTLELFSNIYKNTVNASRPAATTDCSSNLSTSTFLHQFSNFLVIETLIKKTFLQFNKFGATFFKFYSKTF